MALIAWWKLNGNAKDSVGDNDGTVNGSPSLIDAKFNQGYNFTTNSHYVSVPNNTLLSTKIFGIATVFSLAGWVYPTNLENWACIINKAFGGSWSNTTAGLWVYQNAVRFVIGSNESGNPAGSSTGPSFNITTNNWYHVVGVADGTNLYLYVNGILRGTNSISNITRTRSENTEPITIGRRSTGTNPSQKGIIQDVRVYDHALSIKEIKELARAKIVHLKLNNSNSVTDDSDYEHDVVVNGATFSTESKIGSGSYEFDNNNIQPSWGENYTVDNNLTISLWVKPSVTTGSQIFASFGTNTDNRRAYFSIHNGNWDMGIQGTAWGAGSQTATTDWTHIAIKFGETSVTMYVNTVLTRTISYTSYDLLANLRLGQYGNGAYPFYGNMQDVKIYTTSLSLSEIEEIYKERGSIDNFGNLIVPELVETGHKPLIMDYTVWEDGQTGGVGEFGKFSNGNSRVISDDPWGKQTVVWQSSTQDPPNATYPSQGGIYHAYKTIDNTKMYRASWWERRVTNNGATYGRYYAGCNGGGAAVLNRSNGAANSNPYFTYWNHSSFVEDEWLLVVGHIWPAGSGTGANHEDSKVYRTDGSTFTTTNDFVFQATTTTFRTRTLAIYRGNVAGMIHHTVYPRLDVVDGTEPSIAELLAGFDSTSIDYIRSKGGTKHIAFDVNSKLTYTGDISEIGPFNNLIGWWPLNGDTKDISGEENDGTNNGATIVPGLNQLAYEFDGSSSYIELTNPLTIFNSSFTISMWCYFNDDSRGILVGDFQRPNSIEISFEKHNNRTLRLYWKNSPDIFTSTNVFELNTWQQIILIRSKNDNEVRFYVQGSLVYTYSGALTDETTTSLHLFGRDNRTGITTLDGQMQDVRIYDRALSDEEVKTLYEITANSYKTKMKKTSEKLFVKGEFIEK